MILVMISLSGCFGIFRVPPSEESIGSAVKDSAKGLGAGAQTKIWTDGVQRETRESFVLKNDTYSELAKKVNPAVVNIFTSQRVETGVGMGLFILPLPNLDMKVQSLGSGFIISSDGFMLTNYHVIKNAEVISVFLHLTNEVQPVKVIGVDPLTDLALLKINTDKNLSFLPLADSDAIEIGDQSVAIGNPFGLQHSLTTGVISAKNRMLSPGTRKGNFEQFLQTSAQINPGNSGGPLLNLHGEVVGINTAIIAQAQGIGFSIPSNLVKELIPDLVRKGRIRRGYFGIAVIDLTPVLAERYDVTQKEGVLVARIDPQGPAASAGIQRGDIIISLDGKAVENANDCARRISFSAPGKQAGIEVTRGGRIFNYTVTTREY